MTVEETISKLENLIGQLKEFDKGMGVYIELDDNCGGSYVSDIEDFKISTTQIYKGEVWISNL